MYSSVIATPTYLPTQFGYDATLPKNKRQAPSGILRSEDAELPTNSRRTLVSGTRDLHRNFSLVAWMVRRHLDYVSTFDFQANTGNDALDDDLESIVKDWSKREHCDVAQRHSLPRIIRLAEMRRTIDGDCFLLKLRTGQLQAIEGDRIRTPLGGMPAGHDASGMIHGVQADNAGRAIGYAVHRRDDGVYNWASSSRLTFERMVSATHVYQHAAYDRFDQVRGISPLACAYNALRDVYEGFDYALCKMKVSQLMALAFYRDSGQPMAPIDNGADGTVEVDGSGYSIDFGRGPVMIDLDPGDRAEFLESKTPSSEMQSFAQAMIQISLAALDIPYSFYSEDFTNYSGARQAWIQYEQSASNKRADNRDMLDHLTLWRILLFIQDGRLPASILPRLKWQWNHRGVPWIDPLKEVNAENIAIGLGLDNHEDVAQRHGRNVYENIDKISRVQAYAKTKGVTLSAEPVEIIDEKEDEANKKKESKRGDNQ